MTEIEQYKPKLARWLRHFLNNRSIRTKLDFGFGVLVVLAFGAVGRTYFASVRTTDSIEQTQTVRVPLVVESGDAQIQLLTMLSNVRGYLATGQSDFRHAYQGSRFAFEEHLVAINALAQQPDSALDADHLAQLQSLYQTWIVLPDQLFSLRDNTLKNQPARQRFEQEAIVLASQINNDIELILNAQADRSPTAANLTLMRDLTAFKAGFTQMIAALQGYVTTGDDTFRFDYSASMQVTEAAWQTLQARKSQLSPQQQQWLAQITAHYDQLRALPPQLLAIMEGDRAREDLYLFQTQAEPLASEMIALLEQIVATQQLALQDDLNGSQRELVATQWQTLGLAVVILAVALALGYLLQESIARRLHRLTLRTGQIIDGDLETRLSMVAQDEIGTLAKQFNAMTDHLQASLRELAEANQTLEDRVQERTLELRARNQDLAKTLSRLKQTQTQLIQTEKMSSLGQMVAGIAHEINNPVNFIFGNLKYTESYGLGLLKLVDLYQRYYPDSHPEIQDQIEELDLEFVQEDLPKILESMHVGATRIQEIVKSLRNFSRLDEADLKESDLHEGIESTLLILQNRLREQRSHPEIQVVREYGQLPMVECYPSQLNQVVMNIVANAIDALETMSWEQPHCITIRTQVLPEQAAVQIQIHNTGDPIPPAIQAKLFDPFFTTKDVGKGTGLGLAISHQIVVDRHRGTLTCRSEPNFGTLFTIQLPLHQPRAEPERSADPDQGAHPALETLTLNPSPLIDRQK
ncbi:MAG: ATP-binding protein [Prochlorothrix sp.]|nr:ATP-binding protein [Prochlorothrix sp.]